MVNGHFFQHIRLFDYFLDKDRKSPIAIVSGRMGSERPASFIVRFVIA